MNTDHPLPDAPETISGDRPIDSADKDRLGFQPLAVRLAAALIDQASAEGLVVGLEGRWGSGKSSLLNLTAKALKALPPETRPVVVEFKPWLIRDRDALLTSFFRQLVGEIELIELESGHSASRDKRRHQELVDRIRNYAAAAETAGSLIELVPVASRVGTILKLIAGAMKKQRVQPSLLQQKEGIDASLAELPRRVVVTIDDVDRLEPREVIELLRLVRSVADFRNVIYVLCYDADILANGIETGLGVDDGHAYLEKIVQVSVPVPIPEPFQLRKWFEQEVAPFVKTDNVDELEEQSLNERLRTVIDREGGRRLTTPRSVVRTLNALSLLVPSLKGEVDLPDLVWLQLIKAGNHKFYRWIEAYSASSAASSSWRVAVSDESKKRTFEELQTLLAEDHISFETYSFELSDYLLGVNTFNFPSEEDKVPLYCGPDRNQVDRAIQDKRLASPDHYRLYFALAQPRFAPKADDFQRLLDAATASADQVAALLIEWAQLKDPTVGTKADVMLDRLRQRAAEGITSQQAAHIFLALTDCMDEAGEIGGRDDFGTPALWREAQRCVPALRTAIGADNSGRVIEQGFGTGRALGWLTDLLRHETFGHGRHGDRKTRETEWLFSEPELDAIIARMLARYRGMALKEFSALPNTFSALFAWAQAGDPEGPRALAETATADDPGLVQVLEGMTTRVRSSGGDYATLNRTNLEHFLDYDRARARIDLLAADVGAPLQVRAAKLRDRFEAADHF